MVMILRSTHVRALLAAVTPALLTLIAGACTPAQDASQAAGNSCNYVNYHHDEAKNAAGPASCATDCDCDGMRTCTAGACQGAARPAVLDATSCNDKEYHWNEAWSPAGPGKCVGDCECDGLRTCTAGACQGTAR